MWCDAYAPHFGICKVSVKSSKSLVDGLFLLTESFCKNYLGCTFVNPFLVVHSTHILVHPTVHRAHWLKSAGLELGFSL